MSTVLCPTMGHSPSVKLRRRHQLFHANFLDFSLIDADNKYVIARDVGALAPPALLRRLGGLFFGRNSMLGVVGRTDVFVDGFNLYHGISDSRVGGNPRNKWLDIRALCLNYIPSDRLGEIFYFTAFADHAGKDPVKRHRLYISVLRTTGVQVVRGRFKEKPMRCRNCDVRYKAHEEKETDVNIAIQIVERSILKQCDSVVVVSGDTDILPAMLAATRFDRQIYALFPPGRKNDDVARGCAESAKIRPAQIQKCRFPDVVTAVDGQEFACPPEWQ
jgi:uncharacterized LabA/DUF88 family protein